MDQRVVRDLLGLGEDAVASVARLRILLASEPSIHGSKQPELPSELESSTSPINWKPPRLSSSRLRSIAMRGVAFFNCCGASNLGNSPQASARQPNYEPKVPTR